MADKNNIYWRLFVELRKEVVERQKIRAQIIGFKITFVSASAGLIGSNLDKVSTALLVIPAFASIFFDFLLSSNNFSIKRVGYYISEFIEPELRKSDQCSEDFLFWEQFLKTREAKQNISVSGNLGITMLAIVAAIIALMFPFKPMLSGSLIVALLMFLVFDLYVFIRSREKFRK